MILIRLLKSGKIFIWAICNNLILQTFLEYYFYLFVMKIMHVITRSDLGGAQSVLINIVNSLCRENEVIVIAGEGDGKMWELLDKRIRRINVPALKRNISIINDIKVLFSFLSIYRRYEPDVIHLHSSKVGLLGR